MRSVLPILLSLMLAVPASPQPGAKSVVDRFLRYVTIDTQSKDDVDTIPSTRKQFDLARLLVEELLELGLADARVDAHGYVTATLPGNLPADRTVPVIGFISHLDTSPEVSGANVRPVIHREYRGGDIVLPGDTAQVITVAKSPRLLDNVGSDIITSDGTTLLGADDKAGCAEIMTMLQRLAADPGIRHGTVKVAFTPDEEVGRGADLFDVKGFGARYAYTVDGEETGEISNETWNADEAIVTVKGRNTHPGTAKGVMVNSLFAMAEFLAGLPGDMKPETTDKRTGFLHAYSGVLEVEESRVKILVRDFDLEGLEQKRRILQELAGATMRKFPEVRIEVGFTETYRNMRLELDKTPAATEAAMEACRRAGVKAVLKPIRGGTDGARLTYMGLPCPNIFTGGENFHGKLEWIPVRGMELAVETLVHLVQIWAEK